MATVPPLLPHETLARVLRLARLNGTGVLVLAGAFALAAASAGNPRGALIGIAIAGAGAFELHGAALLRARAVRGMNWLINSQFYLLAVVLGYVAWQLQAYDFDTLQRMLQPALQDPQMQAKMRETNMTEADLLRVFAALHRTVLVVVGIGTLVYQGLMMRYYSRRRSAVADALDEIAFEEEQR